MEQCKCTLHLLCISKGHLHRAENWNRLLVKQRLCNMLVTLKATPAFLHDKDESITDDLPLFRKNRVHLCYYLSPNKLRHMAYCHCDWMFGSVLQDMFITPYPSPQFWKLCNVISINYQTLLKITKRTRNPCFKIMLFKIQDSTDTLKFLNLMMDIELHCLEKVLLCTSSLYSEIDA